MKVPKTVTTFSPGDVCFAKVRGFPAWPARVIALAEENAAKQYRYHVVFFGTGETGLMKGDEMFDYLSNKDKFVKTVKRKGFLDGMAEIEAYLEQKNDGSIILPAEVSKEADETLSVEPTEAAQTVPTEPADESKEATDEGLLVIDENRGGEKKKRVSIPKKKSINNRKRQSSLNDDAPNSSRAKLTPGPAGSDATVTSRSGRKIKPKKFSDDVAGAAEDPPKAKKTPRTYNANNADYLEFPELSAPNYTEEDANEMPIKDCTESIEWPGREILAKLPTGQLCRVKVDLLRPENFPSEEARVRWDQAVARNASKLKLQLRDGKISIEQYLDKSRSLMLSQGAKLDATMDQKQKQLKWLEVECRILDIDKQIRTFLGLDSAHVEECFPLLDELAATPMDPLMLKKHPHCVETIKKVRRYVGNVSSWQLTDEEKIDFQIKAQQVRMKAEFVYNKLKTMFLVAPTRGFWDVFTESVKAFMDKTKGLSLDAVYKITEDPTVLSSQFDPRPTADKEEVESPVVETAGSNGLDDFDEELENRPPLN